MFDYITGKKIKSSAGTMVVENNGIGYSICVSDECIRFFENAEVVRVYTYLSVREDGISLFGFYGEEERAMFEKLVHDLAEKENVTEHLKATDQIEWVRRMNNIRSRAEEIVNAELIFI